MRLFLAGLASLLLTSAPAAATDAGDSMRRILDPHGGLIVVAHDVRGRYAYIGRSRRFNRVCCLGSGHQHHLIALPSAWRSAPV